VGEYWRGSMSNSWEPSGRVWARAASFGVAAVPSSVAASVMVEARSENPSLPRRDADGSAREGSPAGEKASAAGSKSSQQEYSTRCAGLIIVIFCAFCVCRRESSHPHAMGSADIYRTIWLAVSRRRCCVSSELVAGHGAKLKQTADGTKRRQLPAYFCRSTPQYRDRR